MHNKSVNGIKLGDKYKENTSVYTVFKIYNSRKGYFSEIYLTSLIGQNTIKVFVGKKESKNLISQENNPYLASCLERIP